MRVFTDAEKQQLQAKIEDEQERQRVLRKSIQIEKEKESKRSKGIISTVFSFKYPKWMPYRVRSLGIISTVFSFKYGFLVFTIWLLIWNVTSLFKRQNYGYDQYGNLIIALMLLFNHLAYNFTKKGWLSRVMKTIAWVWIAFVWAYLFWTGGV